MRFACLAVRLSAEFAEVTCSLGETFGKGGAASVADGSVRAEVVHLSNLTAD